MRMEAILRILKKIIPQSIFTKIQPAYHWLWAWASHLWYGMPSKKIRIVAVTGTKGKSSTTEILDSVLRAGGFTTAVAGTIRFSIGDSHESNLFKQSMPGRGYLQKFLRKAVNAGCDWVVMEMTSEGAKQFRNRFIYIDALIITNLQPEHLESHGGFENYKQCKLDIVRHSLNASPKRPRVLITNKDDQHHESFDAVAEEIPIVHYSAKDTPSVESVTDGISFDYKDIHMHTKLIGAHNLSNILSAIKIAEFAGMNTEQIISGVESLSIIPGRGQAVKMGQGFTVIVDYAHTNDSLEAIYKAYEGKSIIGILGACGGGRDRWKRPDFGTIAERACKYVVLTNEDPYDEDPMQIITDMEDGMDKSQEGKKYIKILDRREAFEHAFAYAKTGDVILITGKGTDPFIMGPNGTRERWSDLGVAKETLRKMGYSEEVPTPAD